MEATYRCLGCGQRFGTRDGYVMTPITPSDDGIEWMLEGPTGELHRCVEVTHDNEVVFQSDADPSPLACQARATRTNSAGRVRAERDDPRFDVAPCRSSKPS